MVTIYFSKSIIKCLHQELELAYKLNNVHLYRMAQALIWIGEGRFISEVAGLLRVSVGTIYNWLKEFMGKGLSCFSRRHYQGRGRKSKLSAEQKQTLYDRVVAGPEANGFDCGVWNSAMIAEMIWVEFGVKYNPRYLSTLLRKLGLSYQKARFISDRQDEEDYEKARK
jgi:putative transposase